MSELSATGRFREIPPRSVGNQEIDLSNKDCGNGANSNTTETEKQRLRMTRRTTLFVHDTYTMVQKAKPLA